MNKFWTFQSPGILLFKRFNSSLPRPDGEFLVLTARNSGILPRKRPDAVNKRTSKNNTAALAELELSQRELLDDQQLLSQKQPVFQNIEGLRPLQTVVSSQHFETLAKTLRKGYTKSQLKDYVLHHNVHITSTVTKPKIVAKLMEKVWGVSKSLDIDSSTVENVIELSERNFVLCIGHNGRLLREWAKSGAVIRVNPEKYQLLIKSSPLTFDWINASIHQMQDNIKVYELDLTEFRKVSQISDAQMKIIQWLTNTYFVKTDHASLIIYSREKRGIAQARALFLHLLETPPSWTSNSFFYDVNQENLPEYRFAENTDQLAIPWHNRSGKWYRWEQIKRRMPVNMDKVNYAPLELAGFSGQHPDDASEIEDQIINKIKSVTESSSSCNVTATLGYLLHHKDGDYRLPNAGLEKVFNTNVPLIRRLAGQLSGYTMDTIQDLDSDMGKHGVELDIEHDGEYEQLNDTQEDAPKDPWQELLEDKPAFTTRPSETAANHNTSQILRIKLVPSPFQPHGSDILNKNPPVEIWCPLENGPKKNFAISMDDVQAVRVPSEHHQYVSLPSRIADIRFTASISSQIELTEELSGFIDACAVTSNGPVYIPGEVTIDGVVYEFSESSFITQAELNFKGKLLQIMVCDGGKVGGHRVEANLVLFNPDGPLNSDEIEQFVKDSFELVDQTALIKVDESIL